MHIPWDTLSIYPPLQWTVRGWPSEPVTSTTHQVLRRTVGENTFTTATTTGTRQASMSPSNRPVSVHHRDWIIHSGFCCRFAPNNSPKAPHRSPAGWDMGCLCSRVNEWVQSQTNLTFWLWMSSSLTSIEWLLKHWTTTNSLGRPYCLWLFVTLCWRNGSHKKNVTFNVIAIWIQNRFWTHLLGVTYGW